MLRAAAALALPTVAYAHGAIITPRSRNSWDFTVGVNTPKDWPSNADCTNVTGTSPADCHNGQAGFYCKQPGLLHRCAAATCNLRPCVHCIKLTTASSIKQSCGGTCAGCLECDHVSGRVQTDICGLGMKATLPDYARSLNINATAGSPEDIYKHNPCLACPRRRASRRCVRTGRRHPLGARGRERW